MILRIILDILRRRWRWIALGMFQIWSMCNTTYDLKSSIDPWSLSIGIAWFIAAISGTQFQAREVYVLPVSRRSWWLARWLLATVGATFVTTLAITVASWVRQPQGMGLEQAALFATSAFLYSGLAMAVSRTVVGRLGDKPVFTGRPGAEYSLVQGVGFQIAVTLTGQFLPIAAPILFAQYLPHAFSAITLPVIVATIVAAAAVSWGFAHTPAIEPRIVGRFSPSTRLARIEREQRRARFSDRLTGIRLALWIELRRCVIAFAAIAVGIVVAWFVVSRFRYIPGLVALLNDVGALPLASRRAQVMEFFSWGILLTVISMTHMTTITSFRPLRALPLSSAKLSGLPVLLGLLWASVLWPLLVALHVGVLGALPVSPRIDLFFWFAGLIALGHAMRLLVPGEMFAKGMAGMLPGLVSLTVVTFFIDSWRPEIVQPAMLVLGVASLLASFLLMQAAVTRSSRLYRQRTAGIRL